MSLWHKINQKHSVYQDGPAEFDSFFSKEAPFSCLIPTRTQESIRVTPAIYSAQFCLPIEFFKYFSHITPSTQENWHSFTSSGTTSANRSISRFSDDGLELYRSCAVKTFFDMLNNFYKEPLKVKGVSLIPNSEIWKKSSLAKMLTWFAEYWEIDFVSEEKLQEWLSKQDKNKPIFIFGTGFHFASLLKTNEKSPLPKESLLFETGGTKGNLYSQTREELYNEIEEFFSIPKNRIISEYSMCEMASQAYDWVDPDERKERDISNRRFRFPFWVKPYVVKQGKLEEEGIGALIVFDPFRIDYPWPLRTQDMVNLRKDSSFTLLGRVPATSLKGCSMGAEQIIMSKHKSKVAERLSLIKEETSPLNLTLDKIKDRVQEIEKLLADLFLDSNFTIQLGKSLGSINIAKSALSDVKKGLPKSLSDWQTAIHNAFSKSTEYYKNWLIILPDTHIQAGIYPLVFGYVAGLNMFIRQTANDENKPESILLNKFKNLSDIKIKTLPRSFRIGLNPIPKEIEAIICYGEDETVNSIRRLSKLPTLGFGETISATFTTAKELLTETSLIVKDSFSLAQKGCFSSRFLIVTGDYTEKLIVEAKKLLLKSSQELIQSSLPLPLQIALEHEYIRLSLLHPRIDKRSDKNEPILPIYKTDNIEDLKWENLQSPCQFVLPTFFMNRDINKLLPHITNVIPTLKKISISKGIESMLFSSAESRSLLESTDMEIAGLGEANAPSLDGYHQKKPLFSPY